MVKRVLRAVWRQMKPSAGDGKDYLRITLFLIPVCLVTVAMGNIWPPLSLLPILGAAWLADRRP